MRYNLCLFDLDGTIVDSAPGIVSSFKYAMRELEIEIPKGMELRGLIGASLRDIIQSRLFLPEHMVDVVIDKYREYYGDKGMYECSLYEGVGELLHKLKNDGVTIALASVKARHYAQKVLEHFKLLDLFAFVGGAELDGSRNKKHEVIEYVLNNIDPEYKMRALMIGDRDYDIKGADRMGIKSCGVLWGYGSKKEFSQAGCARVVADAEELYRYIVG